MSLDFASSDQRVCCVHCNFCNTTLAVSVPCSVMYNAVTVRCGHCGNLISLNMGALLQTVYHQNLQTRSLLCQGFSDNCQSQSSSKCKNKAASVFDSSTNESLSLSTRATEKKQRVPSAYNRFIKEEIQRIKANNPDISHREAFSTAAKNWAHLPRMNSGHGGQN
nr:YABBY4 protein [Averrhoa carambola]